MIRPRICLSMIVRNEAPVIRRCLASVLPLIDHWAICDTGSTDGTQDIIRSFFEEHAVPGELRESPWRDFAHNRNEALELARPHGDYVLIIDADDALELPPGFARPELAADGYTFDIHDVNIAYRRIQIVRSALPWRWRGVLHEFLHCDAPASEEHLPIVMRRNHDGARRRDPSTYARDASILEAAIFVEEDPWLRARYVFYHAQSLRDMGEQERAMIAYLMRAEMGFWQEEVYWSLYQAALMMERLGRDEETVLAAYRRAAAAAPHRIEALFAASRYCFAKGRNEEGFRIAEHGIGKPAPEGGLFVETWIHDYGLLDQYAANGYWAGHYPESFNAALEVLASGKVPAHELPRLARNFRALLDKVRPASAPDYGRLGQESYPDQHVLKPERLLRSGTTAAPRVLIAILAKQKEEFLPLYLDCIEALDYPKSSIVLYIRTNNNTDRTEEILREWIARVGHSYAAVEFDPSDVDERVEQFGAHEWNAIRFRVLGRIRNESLRKTREHGCDWYFVADIDNFIRRCTLRELVATGLPIVAPLLRDAEPSSYYSNLHAEIDDNGYFRDCAQYELIMSRRIQGLIEVPLVHCTYAVRADVIEHLNYDDGSGRHEYVVLSDSARKASIPQYFDNRQVYGYITFSKNPDQYDENSAARAERNMWAVRKFMSEDRHG